MSGLPLMDSYSSSMLRNRALPRSPISSSTDSGSPTCSTDGRTVRLGGSKNFTLSRVGAAPPLALAPPPSCPLAAFGTNRGVLMA